MEAISDKLMSTLESSFPPPALIKIVAGSWGAETPNYLIYVINDEFQGVDDFARQELVWDAIRSRITPQERLSVSLVITATHEEEEFATSEGASRDD